MSADCCEQKERKSRANVLIVEKAAIIVNIILRAFKALRMGKLFLFSFTSAAAAVSSYMAGAETSLESRENNFVLSPFKYILP